MIAGYSEASMKKLILSAVLAVVLLSSLSCLLGTTVHFENRSTWAVSVWPNQQTWDQFALNPGQTRDVKTDMEAISFYFDPVTNVYFDWADAKTVVFRDRTTPISGK
jgi:hypothetical protein